MGRTRLLLTVAVIVVTVCGAAFGVRMRKLKQSSDRTAGAAEARAKGNPFRSAVVELTFRSRSVHQGVEFLSSTGRRIEYIDAAGGRRREDYSSNDTAMGDQLPSAQSVTWIFDGANVYISVQKDSKRLDKMMEIRQGFNQPIWKDAAVENEELKEPGLTTSTEEFLGRLCGSGCTCWRDSCGPMFSSRFSSRRWRGSCCGYFLGFMVQLFWDFGPYALPSRANNDVGHSHIARKR